MSIMSPVNRYMPDMLKQRMPKQQPSENLPTAVSNRVPTTRYAPPTPTQEPESEVDQMAF